jgi:hypothetical protein
VINLYTNRDRQKVADFMSESVESSPNMKSPDRRLSSAFWETPLKNILEKKNLLKF